MAIFIGVMLVLLAAYIFFGWYFSSILIFPKTYDHDYAINYDRERGRLDEEMLALFQQLDQREVTLASKHGYDLHGVWIPNGHSQKTVVLCHGITWNLIGSVKYSGMFYKMGYNIFMYDHRNHGKSGGDRTTFGYFEKEDLKLWLDWLEDKLGKGTYIGTHGESMGAATVLQHLGIDSRVKFCIADCPYSDLKTLLKYRLEVEYKIKHLPLIPIASLFAKWRAGMYASAVSPIKAVAEVETPIFWIHGLADDYIPPSMSEDMYQAKHKGIKKLLLIPEARHAASFSTDPVTYQQAVSDFLKEVEGNEKY